MAEPASRCERTKLSVGFGVAKKQSETRGKCVVIELAGCFLHVEEAGGREYRCVAGEHRLCEAVTELELLVEERNETLHICFHHRPAISTGHESTDEACRVLARVLCCNVYPHILHAGATTSETPGAGSSRVARGWGRRDNLEGNAARFFLGEATHGKVAEHLTVSRASRFLLKRAFHFDPLECYPRHSILLSERVDVGFFGAIDTCPEEPHTVGLEGLIRRK